MTADPYEILGITPDTSEDEIKKKYRTLVKQYHPDLHPGDEEAAKKMSEINEAYELIKSGEAAYTSAYKSTAAPSGSYSRNGQTYTYEYADPEDFFRSFFGTFGAKAFYYDNIQSDPYVQIEKYIRIGAYNTAASILNGINVHDGKWNYYAALICYECNRYSEARDYAAQAVRTDPDNREYRELYENIQDAYSEYDRSIVKTRRIFTAISVGLAILFLMQMFSPLLHIMFY